MPLSTADAESATQHTSTRRATTRWGKEAPTVTVSDLGRSYLIIQPNQKQLIKDHLGWLYAECRDSPRAKHILTESSDGTQIHTHTEVEMNYPLGEAVISDRDELRSSTPARQLTARIRVKTAGRSLPIDFKEVLSDRVRLLLDSTGRIATEQTDHFRVYESDGTKTIDQDGLPRFDAVKAHQWPDRHLLKGGAPSEPTEEVYQVTFHDVCSAYVFDGVDTFNTVEINRTAVQCTEADVVVSLLVSDPLEKVDSQTGSPITVAGSDYTATGDLTEMLTYEPDTQVPGLTDIEKRKKLADEVERAMKVHITPGIDIDMDLPKPVF